MRFQIHPEGKYFFVYVFKYLLLGTNVSRRSLRISMFLEHYYPNVKYRLSHLYLVNYVIEFPIRFSQDKFQEFKLNFLVRVIGGGF